MLRYLPKLYRMSSQATSEADVSHIADNLRTINDRIRAAFEASPRFSSTARAPRLVAVSKTKSVDFVLAAYAAGQRHFGENYVQEITEKSNHPQLLQLCPDIKWHFIGNLQSNKVTKLMKCPRLDMIETVDSQKLASMLDGALRSPDGSETLSPLKVMVQVNTSAEAQKQGLQTETAVELALHIIEKCPRLQFSGFMTIGSLEHSTAASVRENPDFEALRKVRASLCAQRGLDESNVELSMGMSGDFEEAIRMGSTNVRIGSIIFGPRIVAKHC